MNADLNISRVIIPRQMTSIKGGGEGGLDNPSIRRINSSAFLINPLSASTIEPVRPLKFVTVHVHERLHIFNLRVSMACPWTNT